jgi:hypothetical protein
MKHACIILLLLATTRWSYDKDYQRENQYEKTDDKTIEIYDEDYNRKGHITKEGDTWIEYDKDWDRIKIYKEEKH